jgi:EmrB/QacA subfamily drug resistance transporter
MSTDTGAPAETFRFSDMLRHGVEPPAADFFVRRSWYPWMVVAVACTGAFMGQLDASIVQLALPALADTFDVSLSQVSWVSLAYLLAFASCLPIFGRLCEMYGRKLLYIGGFLLFSVGTILCGMAWDLPSLVAFRVLQGVGGSILGANSIAMLVKSIGADRRGRALGIFAASQAVGVSLGPALGGVLLDAFGWRWLFWTSAPFGLAVVVLGWWVLPRTADSAQDKVFDWRGALLLMPALTLLMLSVNQVSAWGLVSPRLIGSVVLALVLLVWLVRHERAFASPLVDLRLFGQPAFTCGSIAVLLGYAMLYGMFFLMAFALVRGYHDTAMKAGLRLAIIPIAIGVVAPFSGGLSERLGTRLLSVAGMGICVLALAVLTITAMQLETSRLVSGVGLALFGAGLGVFLAPNNHATVKAAPADLSGEAGAMLNLMRVLGTSLGVASASSMLSWRFRAAGGDAAGHHLMQQDALGAVVGGLVMIAVFAVLAGCMSLVRGPASD